MNWQRKLSHPLKDKHGRELRTLHEARAYVIELGAIAERPQWRHAGALMLEAAKGRGIKACTDQIELALFLDGRLWLMDALDRR